MYVCMYVCTYVRMYVCMYVNPPAPKVLKRGSLAVDATNGTICQSGTASVGGGMFQESRPPKSARDCGNRRILQMGLLRSLSFERWRKTSPVLWRLITGARYLCCQGMNCDRVALNVRPLLFVWLSPSSSRGCLNMQQSLKHHRYILRSCCWLDRSICKKLRLYSKVSQRISFRSCCNIVASPIWVIDATLQWKMVLPVEL